MDRKCVFCGRNASISAPVDNLCSICFDKLKKAIEKPIKEAIKTGDKKVMDDIESDLRRMR